MCFVGSWIIISYLRLRNLSIEYMVHIWVNPKFVRWEAKPCTLHDQLYENVYGQFISKLMDISALLGTMLVADYLLTSSVDLMFKTITPIRSHNLLSIFYGWVASNYHVHGINMFWMTNLLLLVIAPSHALRLTHWGQDKMDAISQTTFSSAFSWMKMFEFLLKFHWSLFLSVQLTIIRHWFR